jgi:hypothetical protein
VIIARPNSGRQLHFRESGTLSRGFEAWFLRNPAFEQELRERAWWLPERSGQRVAP